MPEQNIVRPGQVLENPVEDAFRSLSNTIGKREIANVPSTVHHKLLDLTFEIVQSLSEEDRFRLANSGELRSNPSMNQLLVLVSQPGQDNSQGVSVDLRRPFDKNSLRIGSYTLQLESLGGSGVDLIFIRERQFWTKQSTRVRFSINGGGCDPYNPRSPVSISATSWNGGKGFVGGEVSKKVEEMYLTPRPLQDSTSDSGRVGKSP